MCKTRIVRVQSAVGHSGVTSPVVKSACSILCSHPSPDMDLHKAIAELRNERDRIDEAILALEKIREQRQPRRHPKDPKEADMLEETV